MSNNQFDTTMLNPREKPVTSDINQAQSQLNRTIRAVLMELFGYRGALNTSDAKLNASGFVADGFRVYASSPAAMEVNIKQGLGFQYNAFDLATDIDGCVDLDDLSQYKPLVLNLPKTIAVPAADPTNPRIDIVEVKYSRVVTNPLSRFILNGSTGAFAPSTVNKTLQFCLDDVVPSINGTEAINYKTGTPAGVPVEPTVTPGYMKIGAVRVEAASVTVPATRVIDTRVPLTPGGVVNIGVTFKVDRAALTFVGTPTIVAPPGWVVGIETGTQFALSQARLRIIPPRGVFTTTSPRAVVTAAHVRTDNNYVNAADVQKALHVASQIELIATSVTSLAGTAYWPNPSPVLPLNSLQYGVSLWPLIFNTPIFDQTSLPDPWALAVNVSIPIGE